MALKKSDLYASLWDSCAALRSDAYEYVMRHFATERREIAIEVRAAQASLIRADQVLTHVGALSEALRTELAADPHYGRPEERSDWFIEPLLTVPEVVSLLRFSPRAVR